jgi:hypothetical protein
VGQRSGVSHCAAWGGAGELRVAERVYLASNIDVRPEKAAATREAWADAVPDLVRRPRDPLASCVQPPFPLYASQLAFVPTLELNS